MHTFHNVLFFEGIYHDPLADQPQTFVNSVFTTCKIKHFSVYTLSMPLLDTRSLSNQRVISESRNAFAVLKAF